MRTQGKVCSRCHEFKALEAFSIERRAVDGRRSNCKVCGAKATKDYQARNRDAVREKKKARYILADPIARKAYARQYYLNHQDIIKVRSKVWKKNNRERAVIQASEWRNRNRDKLNRQAREWRAKNAESVRRRIRVWAREDHAKFPWKAVAKVAKRRALLFGATIADLTSAEWEAIKRAYQQRCAYCKRKKPLTRDHVLPLSKGGQHTASNIVPACVSCNSRKRDKEAPTYQPLLLLADI